MKKLRNKVFYTLFSILSLTIVSFLLFLNWQNYNQQKRNVDNNLIMAYDDKKDDFDKPEPVQENIRFMDNTIYTVLIDCDDNIKDIINHSADSIKEEYIREVAQNILESGDAKEKYIGFLYTENYSYTYHKGRSLVIFSNQNVQNNLKRMLYNSLIALFVAETVIYFITQLITVWIIKPVKESFEKQKQFIADASHELKTPLSVIIADSDALRDNPTEMKWLNNIQSEADRMNLLISDLLQLASNEQVNLELKEGDLSQITELALLTFEVKAYEKYVRLDYKIQPGIMMKLNENNIRQLIEILLDNAVEHSDKFTTIFVDLHTENNQIKLTVTNSGEEIVKGEEEKIFERFYRGDKSRNRNNNHYGLGLAIAKNIVENHHGSISATSDNNKTVFKVLFPK